MPEILTRVDEGDSLDQFTEERRLKCVECGAPMRAVTAHDVVGNGMHTPMIWRTLVGYTSPPGHNHDDNCATCEYICAAGHTVVVSRRNTCPTCEWQGKDSCWCHPGPKLEDWPVA